MMRMNISLILELKDAKIWHVIQCAGQTSSDGNQTTSTLSISFSKTDANKLLTCKAYNHAVPSEPLEDGWKLDIQCYNQKVFMEMKELDEEEFLKHTRMCCKTFNLLLALIGRKLKKPKQIIDPEERLAITLLYFGQGCSLQSIAWSHKLEKTTVRKIVLETCKILRRILSPIYISEQLSNTKTSQMILK
ncbi:hypothetical protein DOY81_009189 [Sarcophaga bullata]|nr:hypothetical protein DOY81_009189 [Sarcophaga bullata]